MRTFLRGKAKLLVLTFAVVLALPAVALASSVDLAVVDVTAPTGSVSLAPGGSEPITINATITGNQEGTATFEVYRDWQLQSNGTFVGSNPKEFTVGPRAGSDDPTLLNTTGTVSVASGVAPSATAKTLTVGVFDITNTNATGAKLSAGRSATYAVTVTAPPPPANTEPQVSVTGVANNNSYEIGSVPSPGCSVTDTEDNLNGSTTAATPVVSAISGTLADYGLGSRTVTCTYTDGGGITRSANATYSIVDTGNPTITDLGPIAGTVGSSGWYTSQVTNRFEASDSGAGFATTGTKPLLSYNIDRQSGATQEGNATNPVVLSSGSVSDVAGNTAANVDSRNYKIDLNNPSLGIVDSNAASANVCTGSAPTKPSFNPTDTNLGSGIDSANTGETWTPPANNAVLGTYTYEAHAADLAGRTATYGPKSYSYTYGVGQPGGASFSGALQPINQDGSSRFKLGSTIPVKFTLTCGSTPITDAAVRLTVKQGDSKADPGTEEAISTAASTDGNLFRLVDATTGTYMFNLSTKSGYLNPGATQPTAFSAGTWTLGINFGDGTSRTQVIQLVSK